MKILEAPEDQNTLHKRDQSKCELLRLLSASIKIHQILAIFEQQIGFSSNFASHFYPNRNTSHLKKYRRVISHDTGE